MENLKKPETTRNIARNALYGFSTWILPLALSFVGTPIIVKSLGNNDYGIYALVLGFIGYSFNLSFGRAITKYIAEFRITGETENIRDVISATFFINIIVGFIGVSIILVLAKWLVINVFQIDEVNQNKTVIAMYLAAFVVFFSMLTQIFNSVLQGIHRYDVYSKIFNFNSIAIMLGNICLVVFDYGLLSLLTWNLAVTCLTSVLFAISSKKLLPEFGISLKIKPSIVKLVLVYSSGIIGYQILANLLALFERGWITRQLGAESLTYYVVPMLLAIYIHAFINSLVQVVFPLASELKNNKEKLLRLYLKASKIVCLLVFFIAFTLVAESRVFLTLWMGAEFAENTYLILIIHTIAFSLVAIQIVSWHMTEGLGYTGYNLGIFLVCLTINISLILSLTENYGNVGLAFGRLGGFGTMFFSIFFVEKWVFGHVQLKFWFRTVSMLGVAVLLGVCVEKLIVSNFNLSWLTFISATFVGGVIYCLTIWMLGLITKEEKLMVRSLLRKQA